MTLFDFLSKLNNTDVKAAVSDEEGNEICKIFTQGVEALDEVYKEKEVISWEIKDRVTINIVVGEGSLSG